MHRRCRHLLTALVVLVCSGAAPARAEDVVRVGVIVSLTVNIDQANARAIADDLADALKRELIVDVIAGQEVERRLPGDGLDDDCVAKPECLEDLGARLEASQLLLLVILRVGDAIQIDPTWADASTGRTLSRDAVRLEAGADRIETLRAAAPALLPAVKRREAPPPDPVVIAPATPPSTELVVAWPVYVAGGVGAAFLIGGIGFGLAASSDESGLEADGCDRVMCEESRVDSMETKALVADVFYTGAVLSAAAAVVLFFVTQDPDPASTVSIEASEAGARAAWRIRF